MRILAIERELKKIESASETGRAILREEAQHAWSLLKGEVIREIWFTRADTRAVVMLECASEAEAERHLATLPLVREGYIAFDVFALRAYDGFDRLLGEK